MKNVTPDYTAWQYIDLIAETHRLALQADRASETGNAAAFHRHSEHYHLAQAALIVLATKGKGNDARQTAQASIKHHRTRAARHRAARLGTGEAVPA